MSETNVLALLDEIRTERIAATQGRHSPECLTFERGRALVLNPRRWTNAERAHVAACGRCDRLMESGKRNAVHPSVWVLVRSLLDLLTDEERTLMEYHVQEGECQACAGRLRRMPAWMQRVARSAHPCTI